MREVPSAEDLLRASDLVLDAKITGVSAVQIRPDLERLWEAGLPSGESTGWPSVDKHYTVVPGQLTVLTGWPGSGKSEWLDALLLTLAKKGWRFGIFSPENHPVELHVAKFLEKLAGKPFGAGPTERISKDELAELTDEIKDWFGFLQPTINSDRTSFSIDEILDACEAHFRTEGMWGRSVKKGLVIDPWNELEHGRPHQLSETEYTSMVLSRVRGWARKNNVHVWIVAHPQKLRRDDGGKLPVPRPDSISGSIHWWNKADNAITVWRQLDEPTKQEVCIYVHKIRFKHVGRPGMVELRYDRVTGRYHEMLRQVNDNKSKAAGIDF